MSFKSHLSWEIHTNVVCANDSQMVAAARGYEADTNRRQADERSSINKQGNKLGDHRAESKKDSLCDPDR